MIDKILFAGTTDPKAAKRLAREAKIELGRILIKKFACNEKYIQLLDDVKGKLVYIYQTSSLDPDEILMETFLIANAAKESGAKKVILISPFLLYSRQDKKTSPEKKEPVSAKVLARLYQTSGIDEIITCHLHSKRILNYYRIKILDLKFHYLFARELREIVKRKENWQVVAPDEGAKKDVEILANLLGNLKVGIFKKQREDPTKRLNLASPFKFSGSVKGKNAILFDDMVDTGGTIIQTKEKLLSLGAKKIILAAIHPILSGKAKEKLKKAKFSKIFFSNSIPIKRQLKNLKIVDIIPEIKKYLSR